jgi:hypothetical protein
MAEKWGCPPWEIWGKRTRFDKLRWLLYWRIFESKRNKA